MISSDERISSFESWQFFRDSVDSSKKKSNVVTDQATKDGCARLDIFNWWKTHSPERVAFVEFVIQSIVDVIPSESNTERGNSLHKLLIGDKRSLINNTRAYKLLYFYQNMQALREGKA